MGHPHPARRPARPGRRTSPACSCAALLRLVREPAVADFLTARGIEPEDLEAGYRRHHDGLDPEPMDWAARLAARRPAGPDHALAPALADFLAVLRSPDCHAGRLLVRMGLPVAALRRGILVEARRADARAEADEDAGPAEVPESDDGAGGPGRDAGTPEPRAARGAAPPDGPTGPPGGDAEPVVPDDLPPIHGRDGVLDRLADAASRVRPRPVLLEGAPGSGRSLVAAHLARVLDVPVLLRKATVYDDEDDLEDDVAQAAELGAVLVLDDLDRALSETPPPWFPALVRAFGRTDVALVVVGASDLRGRIGALLPGLRDVFDVVTLPPLVGADLERAVAVGGAAILDGHGLAYAEGCGPADVVELAGRFLGGRAMPGRALDVLDLACARAARRGRRTLGRDTLVAVVAERSGLPHERVAARDDRTLLDLERHLARRVVGHEAAVATIASLIRRNRAGFAGHRPVATVLLLGPSGVGKTEIAKALAAVLYDGDGALLRLDMSEYAEPHAVARIVGAPPGYVGYEQGGVLTDPLLARPHRVVLLDEIEKAHRDVHQLLLQVFDDGRLSDGKGRRVDFSEAVVVLTSNLGSALLHEDPACPAEHVLAEAARAFPVELWNRIEAPLVLRPLARPELVEICKRLARRASDALFRSRGIRFSLSAAACEALVDAAGDDPSLGARPLRHLLARHVETKVAAAILAGTLPPGSQVLVDHDGRTFRLC